MRSLIFDPRVRIYLAPLPAGATSAADAQPDGPGRPGKKARKAGAAAAVATAQHAKEEPKGKGKAGVRGKGKGMKNRRRPAELEGNASSWKGQPICWDYNTVGCDSAADGGQCRWGLHVCAEPDCGRHHPVFRHR